MKSVFWTSLAAAALSPHLLVAAETVDDRTLKFRLSVPDGFVADPDKVNGDTVHAFQRSPEGDQRVGVFVLITRLGGVIGREKLDIKDIAGRNPEVTVQAARWRGFDIEVIRVPEEIQGVRLVTLNAQVPLRPQAIQVGVVAEASREEEARQVLDAVLERLDGETNWLTQQERVNRAVEGGSRLIATCAMLLAAMFGVVFLIWRAARRAKTNRTKRR